MQLYETGRPGDSKSVLDRAVEKGRSQSQALHCRCAADTALSAPGSAVLV